MSAENLRVEREDGIVTLTIERPQKRNALHGPLWTAIRETAQALAKAPPRVVILTGAGGHFSAGMDLGMDNPLLVRLMPALMEKDEAALRSLILELKAVPDAIASIPCPVIAAIEGACAGGGLELALAADLRVAASDAFFSLPETRVGMMPDVGGTVRSVRLLGPARAAELVLTGKRFTAEHAERWGLVNRVVAPGGALAAAKALANEIMENGPQSTAAALSVLRQVEALDDSNAFEVETEGGVRALVSGECIEGTMSFMERRAPAWAKGS